jgi:DNA-binding MarR family transcriptional regulator
VQNSAPYEDLGAATSAVTMFRLIGGSLGTAVLGTLFAQRAADLAPRGEAVAFSSGLAAVFAGAAAVACAGFVLSWLVPEPPLRETVAAANASMAQEAGKAFPMPTADDGSLELLRGLAILADRDVQRAYIEGITKQAGVDLDPASARLLVRMQECPDADAHQLARKQGLSPGRADATVAALEERHLIAAHDGPDGRRRYVLTETGCDVYDRLTAVRRERLASLYRDWPPEQRHQVALMLQRIANEIVPPRAA